MTLTMTAITTLFTDHSDDTDDDNAITNARRAVQPGAALHARLAVRRRGPAL